MEIVWAPGFQRTPFGNLNIDDVLLLPNQREMEDSHYSLTKTTARRDFRYNCRAIIPRGIHRNVSFPGHT